MSKYSNATAPHLNARHKRNALDNRNTVEKLFEINTGRLYVKLAVTLSANVEKNNFKII
ncbi:hypothetical protein CHS0354_033690, partial [Potamilus streckersoni]